jgi:hypothetical protein
MMYVNENNRLLSVITELEEFRKSYSDLLNKSKDRIENKDYSSFAKLYNLDDDPAKWKWEDKRNYMIMEIKEMRKVLDSDYNTIGWFAKFFKENSKRLANQIKESFQELSVLQERYGVRTNPYLTQDKDITLKMHKYLSNLESSFTEIKSAVEDKIKTIYNVKNYEIHFLLTDSIIIYYWFIKIMMFRTVFVWPNDIIDKQVLFSLYSIVFRIISEIYTELLEFLKMDKFGILGIDKKTPIEKVAYTIETYHDVVPHYLHQYQGLDMKSEINSVSGALVKLSEEIKTYNFIDMSNMEIQSAENLDGLLRMVQSLEEMIKKIQWSKNDSNVSLSEYIHNNQLILQAAKELAQIDT